MVKRNDLHGSFVLSLDFEMMWGIIDVDLPEQYGVSNIRQVRQVIPQLIDMFNRYQVKSTFATVGLIFCKDKEDAIASIPEKVPSYDNPLLSPYNENYIAEIKDEYKDLYFAPELIEKLKESPNVEVGTHTFCHYYCWAKGQTNQQFEMDIVQACKTAEERGLTLRSIVFPRNEVEHNSLRICADHGITVYRGNAKKFYAQKNNKIADYFQRFCRLLNTYVKIGGHSVIKYSEIDTNARCINIPATRFLRPYSPRLKRFEGLRLKLIKDEMEYAAKNNALYHLWWHPHNFGANTKENFAFLEEILKHYAYCHEKYGMQSYTMSEMAEYIQGL